MLLRKFIQIGIVCLISFSSFVCMASSNSSFDERTLLNHDLKPRDLRVFGQKDNSNIIYIFFVHFQFLLLMLPFFLSFYLQF